MNNFNEYEKLVEKWESTGLLTDINDVSKKIKLSNILEEIADNLMHDNDDTDVFETKVGIMIPLAVRIFREGIENIDYDKLSVVINTLYPKLQSMIDEADIYMFAESEFVVLCQEKYINLYGDKNE